jgi:hypothetical protein
VLKGIVAYTEKELSGEVTELLLKYGFSFDIALQEDGSVQLVEINPFGALSGCGACLFNLGVGRKGAVWAREGAIHRDNKERSLGNMY